MDYLLLSFAQYNNENVIVYMYDILTREALNNMLPIFYSIIYGSALS